MYDYTGNDIDDVVVDKQVQVPDGEEQLRHQPGQPAQLPSLQVSHQIKSEEGLMKIRKEDQFGLFEGRSLVFFIDRL